MNTRELMTLLRANEEKYGIMEVLTGDGKTVESAEIWKGPEEKMVAGGRKKYRSSLACTFLVHRFFVLKS